MQGGGRLAAGEDPPAKSAICARQRERWRGGEADWPRACRYQCTPRRAVRRTARHTTRQATTATTASMRRARPAHDGRTGSRVISGTRRGHSHLKRTLLSSFVCVDYDSESSPSSTHHRWSVDGWSRTHMQKRLVDDRHFVLARVCLCFITWLCQPAVGVAHR